MPPIFHDLKDANVYITGGGSGIGAALTDAFLSQGSKVAFIDREDASVFCDEMEQKHGARPLFLQGDITDTDHLKATMDQLVLKLNTSSLESRSRTYISSGTTARYAMNGWTKTFLKR